MKPGIAYCLQRFQPLVQQLARSHWVDHIKRNRLNRPMVGEADDLESFLFETSRQARFMIPMALSLGYGILFSTFISLVIVPGLYMILEDMKGWFRLTERTG